MKAYKGWACFEDVLSVGLLKNAPLFFVGLLALSPEPQHPKTLSPNTVKPKTAPENMETSNQNRPQAKPQPSVRHLLGS